MSKHLAYTKRWEQVLLCSARRCFSRILNRVWSPPSHRWRIAELACLRFLKLDSSSQDTLSALLVAFNSRDGLRKTANWVRCREGLGFTTANALSDKGGLVSGDAAAWSLTLPLVSRPLRQLLPPPAAVSCEILVLSALQVLKLNVSWDVIWHGAFVCCETMCFWSM